MDSISDADVKEIVAALTGVSSDALGSSDLDTALLNHISTNARGYDNQAEARTRCDQNLAVKMSFKKAYGNVVLPTAAEQVHCYLRLSTVLRRLKDHYGGRSGRYMGPDTSRLRYIQDVALYRLKLGELPSEDQMFVLENGIGEEKSQTSDIILAMWQTYSKDSRRREFTASVSDREEQGRTLQLCLTQCRGYERLPSGRSKMPLTFPTKRFASFKMSGLTVEQVLNQP